MSPPGAGGVGLGVSLPAQAGLPFPLPISSLPRSRRRPPPIRPPPNGDLPYPQYARSVPLMSPNEDEDEDDCLSILGEDDPPGGKKRKVPVPLVPGSDADVDTGRDGADRNPPRSAREDTTMAAQQSVSPIIRRMSGSQSALLLSQRRALFQKRKAGMVALYLDAQGAVEAKRAEKESDQDQDKDKDKDKDSKASDKPADPLPLPDVGAFERLLPVLEDIDTWPPDAPGWRDGDDAAKPVPRRTLERWRTGFARRKRIRMERVPVVRGGWAPEGSFELDIPTSASARTRSRARERVALARLADQLRALVLATNKLPSQPEPSPAPSPTTALPPQPEPPAVPKKSKKKKKKKRTTLANEGNPHHVDKYRPSRPVPVSDPYEPWPHHAAQLFPPPMRVLAARPGGKDVRPGEDEYICFSCQYALFYGSEAQRKHAIKQRRAELARREKLRARMYDVAHGTRSRRHSADSNGNDDDEDDDDDQYEDDDEDDDEGCGSGHGRCTCGRALKDEPKPPDKPP